jgi:hypothetical protein
MGQKIGILMHLRNWWFNIQICYWLKFEVELGALRFRVFKDLRLAHQRTGNRLIVDEISQAAINFDALAHGEADGTVFDKFD